jgi:hypothetical protein
VSLRRPWASKAFSRGGYWSASRAISNIAAVPQRRPNAPSAAASPPAPLAATASCSGRSMPNTSTSANGGDWFGTSWLSERFITPCDLRRGILTECGAAARLKSLPQGWG